MFSYYGSKSKMVNYYPSPKYKKIIEPFAGSARYALKWFEGDVLLVDKYETIIELWKWLQKCQPNDILRLPILKNGEDLREHKYLTDNERFLIGFCINPGSPQPKNIQSSLGRFSAYWEENRIKIANNLFKIRHWEIKLGCYTDIPNEEATWFIDPPYEFGGEHYKEPNNNLNFVELAKWCKSRNGQAIVCENSNATWLPFKPIKEFCGARHKSKECIWSNHKTNYDAVQQTLHF